MAKAGRTHYDWINLKAEFISGDWLSIKDFFKEKGIPIANYVKTKGWLEARKGSKEKALEISTEKLIQSDISNIMDMRDRQARLARYMQLKGAEKLKELDVTNIDEARRLIATGMKEERVSLGAETGKGNMTQININTGPKTNLDRLVEGANYEELLGLIAELKRERARRSSAETPPESDGEVEEGGIE